MTALAALLTAGTVMIGNASAQIWAFNYASADFGLSGSAFSINYNVANPNDAIVIGLYVDNGNSAINSLTYNSVSPTGSIPAGSGRLSLFYFAKPATGASTFSGTTAQASQSNCGYSIWELAGVDLTAPVATSAPIPSLSGATTITTTAANSFIIDELGLNNGGNPSGPDGDSVLTKIGEVDLASTAGGGYMATGTATGATAGTYNLGWTPSGGSYVGETALAFAPTTVPEPSTLALASLSGVAFLLAIRRQKK